MAIYLANDKYRALLRATWIASPPDSSILVNAIPTNVPTYVVLGWGTAYETLFSITGVSGTNSSDYALTGVVRIKGANTNIPENTAVNCLNNEEFFNQYANGINDLALISPRITTAITDSNGNEVIKIPATGSAVNEITITNSATGNPVEISATGGDSNINILIKGKGTGGVGIIPRVVTAASYTTDTGTSLSVATADQFQVTAQAGALKFNNPGGTPVAGQKLIIRVKDDGTPRALTYDTQFRSVGVTLPTTTTTSKTTYIGLIFNATDTKWDCVATVTEA